MNYLTGKTSELIVMKNSRAARKPKLNIRNNLRSSFDITNINIKKEGTVPDTMYITENLYN